MPNLQDPIRIGAWNLRNRIIMASLTRCRASEGRVPNELMAECYRQRSNAGLIISEATSISAMGVGYSDAPGTWSDEQVEGWKLITRGVHKTGGTMVLQLWHVGRISDPIYLDGKLPVAPSAIAARRACEHAATEGAVMGSFSSRIPICRSVSPRMSARAGLPRREWRLCSPAEAQAPALGN